MASALVKILPRSSRCLCSFSTSSVSKRHDLAKQGRMMEKLMKSDKKTRTKKSTHESKSKNEINLIAVPGPIVTETRRQMVLNTMFLDRISDVMSTGELGDQLTGYGISILNVKVTKDFSIVNVYWAASGTEQDSIIQDLLNRSTGKLRQNIANTMALGTVPHVHFIKDLYHHRINEVKRLLEIADFGPDEDRIMIEDGTEENVPRMRMDIFGLDHELLMAKVKRAKSRKQSPVDDEVPPRYFYGVKAALQLTDNNEDIARYLKERRIRLKKYRQQLAENAEVSWITDSDVSNGKDNQWEEEDEDFDYEEITDTDFK